MALFYKWWCKRSDQLEALYKFPVFSLFTVKINKITENLIFPTLSKTYIARFYKKFPALKNRELTGNCIKKKLLFGASF